MAGKGFCQTEPNPLIGGVAARPGGLYQTEPNPRMGGEVIERILPNRPKASASAGRALALRNGAKPDVTFYKR
jgi:hypothetical protein